MPKKPTGQQGPVKVQFAPTGAKAQWDKIKWPESKDEIEQRVVDLFAAEFRKAGAIFHDVKQNPENHFDFTLSLPGGTVFMDLAEIIYRDAEGRPYEGDNIKIETYKFAERIRDAVLAKSIHYGKAGKTPIHLLTYITHWRFSPSETVIQLVQHFLQQTPPIMENVFFLSPLNETSANLRVLYPSKNPMEGRDPAEFKDHWYLNLNPGKFCTARRS